MKILAFSDLHHSTSRAAALVQASHDADLVIGAGDFCNMRQGLDDAMALLLTRDGEALTAEEITETVTARLKDYHETAARRPSEEDADDE